MVISNFNILWTRIRPAKTNSPLLVYANAVLADPITS
jgi:hypothetical protein